MSHVIAIWILAGWVVVSILAAPALSALCRAAAHEDRPPVTTRYPE